MTYRYHYDDRVYVLYGASGCSIHVGDDFDCTVEISSARNVPECFAELDARRKAGAWPFRGSTRRSFSEEIHCIINWHGFVHLHEAHGEIEHANYWRAAIRAALDRASALVVDTQILPSKPETAST